MFISHAAEQYAAYIIEITGSLDAAIARTAKAHKHYIRASNNAARMASRYWSHALWERGIGLENICDIYAKEADRYMGRAADYSQTARLIEQALPFLKAQR